MSDANQGRPSGKPGPTELEPGKLNPGDEAQPGTPGTGENVCPECQGSGTFRGGACPNCDGTGIVIEGIGGG